MQEFYRLTALVKRNVKVYFKDKMLFFVSLITPLILIVLFLTFLGKAYEDSLLAFVPEDVQLPSRLINGFTGSWLFSSILSTSCITVAFCSNVMVNDKLNGCVDDFNITPVKKSTLQLSYFISNFLTTLIVAFAAFGVGMVYLAIVGWYLKFTDVLMIIVVVLLNTLLGTLLASIIGSFINSQGGLSAVCTLVSSMYGFLCGAYMPISQFASAIQTFVGLLPGTYSTILFRRYFMGGATDELAKYLSPEGVEGVRSGFDGSITMFGGEVPAWAMFLIVAGASAVLFAIYLLITYLKHFKRSERSKKAKIS